MFVSQVGSKPSSDYGVITGSKETRCAKMLLCGDVGLFYVLPKKSIFRFPQKKMVIKL